MIELVIDPANIDQQKIDRAAEVIRSGGLVAFPTETVYGLGANALDPNAVEKIFDAKNRPAYNPLIVHVASTEEAKSLVESWPQAAELLAAKFWPGPLTLVLPKKSHVPPEVSAGLATVAIRVPRHPIAHALIAAAGVPIAAPSANRSNELSPTRAEHVRKSLGDAVDVLVDGGKTAEGIESTVVDLSQDRPALLRPGTITVEQIEELIGPLERSLFLASAGAPARSPGMMERHYAPKAELVLYKRDEVEKFRGLMTHAREHNLRVGAIAFANPPMHVDDLRLVPVEPRSYAHSIYSTLHELDDAGCGLILVEQVPENADWEGVRDRLRRAAHSAT